jgi:hypothetical protein
VFSRSYHKVYRSEVEDISGNLELSEKHIRYLCKEITRVDGSIGAFPSFHAASKYVLNDMPTKT